jgi:chaperonin GroES
VLTARATLAFFSEVHAFPTTHFSHIDDGVAAHEGSTAARPHHRQAHRRRRTEGRRHHHPRYRQGEAAAGQGHRRGNGKVKDDGTRLPLDVKEGDTILFGKYSGQEIKIEGEEYLIMREDEVLAVLE